MTNKKGLSIISRVPIPGKRSQEYAQWEDGSITRLCYAPHNPHYYLDSALQPHPIDPLHTILVMSGTGEEMRLAGKNVVSMGRLTGNSKKKYLGLRPDVNQDGSEQLEFDLDFIELNGEAAIFEMADLVTVNSRQRCRQLFPMKKGTTSFRIGFTLHTTGLRMEQTLPNEFWFYSVKKGEFRFRFRKPVLTDDLGNVLGQPDNGGLGVDYSAFLAHSLVDNGDETYTYIKESLPAFATAELPAKNVWIDADTYYAESSDGYVGNKADDTWANVRNASAGLYVNDTAASYAWAICAIKYSEAGYPFGVWRSFLLFDVSGMSGNAVACDLVVVPYDKFESPVSAQLGTQASTLGLNDYDNFSGIEYAYVAWSAGAKTFTFPAQGITDLNNCGGTMKTCLRERSKDYLDVEADGYDDDCGLYFTESANDPYLSITEAAVTGSMFFGITP